jgi:pentatricopeptide repeat protein
MALHGARCMVGLQVELLASKAAQQALRMQPAAVDASTWHAVLACYHQYAHVKNALQLWQMTHGLADTLHQDAGCCNMMLSILLRHKQTEEAKELAEHMLAQRLDFDLVNSNALRSFRMYRECQ